MLSGISSIFSKNFGIGYFVPASAFIACLLFVLQTYHIPLTEVLKTIGAPLPADLPTIVIILAVTSIGLLGINRQLLRFLSGYGTYNPLRLLERRERNIFTSIRGAQSERDFYRDAAVRSGDDAERDRLTDAYSAAEQMFVENFPSEERLVLGTRFGNVIRAAESYPRVVYGLEGVAGWNRLALVLPQDARDAVEDAKAVTDFWANLVISGAIILVTYAALWAHHGHMKRAVLVPLLLGATWFCWRCAINAAGEWSELTRSSFDLFRIPLAKQLGLDLPRSLDAEREMWTAFSQSVVYRLPPGTVLGHYRLMRPSGDE